MGTVEGKKQEKRRALLEAAYDLFLERGAAKTSVEDITSRAKVAKGTFYLYFQDKGAVMQALLGRVSYQLLSDACEAVEKQTELENFPDKMVAVIDHIIETLRKYQDLIACIHIADAPGRGEPGTGCINYRAVLRDLYDRGYGGMIAFELFPQSSSDDAVWAINSVRTGL